ncbi:hypothetical protein BJ138DRAFT_1106837 [Hygrophoropsis aurantiaca]|uniref:Uncharacterized protein n=1 Tax=Hygrophoropsis aurantiaca TaxID=72124 RepID=A0ACB7ZTP8_9AGAM|nr:hypothetical protein BJ138DRAFT_1106837 [Hygrophoropsis aurantiaca]
MPGPSNIVSQATQMLNIAKSRSSRAHHRYNRPNPTLKAGCSTGRRKNLNLASTSVTAPAKKTSDSEPAQDAFTRCSGCGDYSDLVPCQVPRCRFSFCCDRLDGEGLGCLSRSEIEALEKEGQCFVCPMCSVRQGSPYKGTMAVLWTSLAWDGLQCAAVKSHLEVSMQAIYGNLWDQLVTLSRGGPHTTRQRCPEQRNTAVLLTIETHSIVETGEIVSGQNITTGDLKSGMVMSDYLSKDMWAYIRSSTHPLKGLVAMLELDLHSRLSIQLHPPGLDGRHDKQLLRANFLQGDDSRKGFCGGVWREKGLSLSMAGGAHAAGPNHTGLTKPNHSGGRQTVTSEELVYGPLSGTPWGVPKPKCSRCGNNLNVCVRVKKTKVSWRCTCGAYPVPDPVHQERNKFNTRQGYCVVASGSGSGSGSQQMSHSDLEALYIRIS